MAERKKVVGLYALFIQTYSCVSNSTDRIHVILMIQRVTDADIIALVSDEVFQPEALWRLLDIQVKLGSSFFCLFSCSMSLVTSHFS